MPRTLSCPLFQNRDVERVCSFRLFLLFILGIFHSPFSSNDVATTFIVIQGTSVLYIFFNQWSLFTGEVYVVSIERKSPGDLKSPRAESEIPGSPRYDPSKSKNSDHWFSMEKQSPMHFWPLDKSPYLFEKCRPIQISFFFVHHKFQGVHKKSLIKIGLLTKNSNFSFHKKPMVTIF